jgi:NADPH:quinone reductase
MPQVSDHQVLIEVHYAGVQFPDALQAQGLYQSKPALPYIPGVDAAGLVIAVGHNVCDFEEGDRVFATIKTGAMAQVIAVDSAQVWRAPKDVHLSRCASIGRNYIAAYHALKVVGEVTAGNLVMIDGASGGVGLAAVQLAKAMGTRVIAGVSVKDKCEYPLAAGADRVLCYGREDDAHRQFKEDARSAAKELGYPLGAHLVIDMVQGDLFDSLVSLVGPLGRIALVGFTGGQRPIRPGLLLIKQAAIIGSNWGAWAAVYPARHRINVQEIVALIESGAARPRADRLFRLSDFAQAFALFENNEGRGNTVINMAGQSCGA